MDLIEQIKEETDWFQKACLIKQFHFGMRLTKGNKRGNVWTLEDTAKTLEYSVGYISESIKLSHHKELSSLSRYVALRVLRNGSHV